VNLTWDEVRARSEVAFSNGTAFCADCRMNYDMVKMPCLMHCADETERLERHRRFMPKVEADIRRLVKMFED
jgi:hypothetical protein